MRGVLIGFLLAAAAAAGAALTSAHAFEDSQFCLAIREMTRSAADVGTWHDRVTRNDGIEISCERKLVHFKRHYSVSAGALQGPWKERKAREWEGTTCNRSLWRGGSGNGWGISGTVATLTRGRPRLSPPPRGRGLHRAIP